jgi:hypothetical protein
MTVIVKLTDPEVNGKSAWHEPRGSGRHSDLPLASEGERTLDRPGGKVAASAGPAQLAVYRPPSASDDDRRLSESNRVYTRRVRSLPGRGLWIVSGPAAQYAAC